MNRPHSAAVVASLIASLAAASPAVAQERGVAFAGGTAGEGWSVFAGGTIALPGWSLGRGPAVRAVASSSSYDYRAGALEIEGRSSAVTLSGVYQWSGEWGYANLSAGIAYVDTDLSPGDPGNPNRGSQWDAVLGADGVRNFGAWRIGGLASYGLDREEYYARADLTRAVSGAAEGGGRVRIGVEAAAQGDPSYERQLYGAVVLFAPASKWELRLSAGAEVETGTGPYGALSVSRVF